MEVQSLRHTISSSEILDDNDDMLMAPVFDESGQVTGVLSLPDICVAIQQSMVSRDIATIMRQIELLNRYSDMKTVTDCHIVRQTNLIGNLLWLAHEPDGIIEIQNKEALLEMYTKLICGPETNLPELAKDSGHLNMLFDLICYPYIPERMEECAAECVLRIVRHCQRCRRDVLKTITGDVLTRIGQFATPRARSYKLQIASALCQGPISNEDFAKWALECFVDRLSEPDDESYDAIIGLAHWIRFIPIAWKEDDTGLPAPVVTSMINGCGAVVNGALTSPSLDWSRPALRVIKEAYDKKIGIMGVDLEHIVEMFKVALNSVMASEPPRESEDDPDWHNWFRARELGTIMCVDIADTLTVILRDPTFVAMFWRAGLFAEIHRAYFNVTYKCKDSLAVCLAHAARSGIPELQKELIKSNTILKFMDVLEDENGREFTIVSCLLAVQHLVGCAAGAGDGQEREICEEEVLNEEGLSTIERLFEHNIQGVCDTAREVRAFLSEPRPPRGMFAFGRR